MKDTAAIPSDANALCSAAATEEDSVRQSASRCPPSFFSRLRSRYLQTLHHTGWGTTALCKLPSSNLDARSPPPPPLRRRITPAAPRPISHEQSKGLRMISQPTNRGGPLTQFASISGFNWCFNSQRLASDWLVIYRPIYNPAPASFAVVFFCRLHVSPQTAHVSRESFCSVASPYVCAQVLSQVAIATLMFERRHEFSSRL